MVAYSDGLFRRAKCPGAKTFVGRWLTRLLFTSTACALRLNGTRGTLFAAAIAFAEMSAIDAPHLESMQVAYGAGLDVRSGNRALRNAA